MPYPVLKIIDDLQAKLSANPLVILQAPPGAGKSTVVPLHLIEQSWLGNKKIIMLEPRRLAARSVAVRMASMIQQEIGNTIGYIVRFDSKVTVQTKVEVVTEGILTRKIQQNSSLDEVGLLIFDEFHERSLHADTALALSLQVQQLLRPDLKILIMSATLDTKQLSATLSNAPVVVSSGKQFPVEVKYDSPAANDHIVQHTAKAIKRALRENFGDILVFLPGAGEIQRVAALLEQNALEAEIFQLFGDLSFKKQQEAILPHPQGKRKVVLATSIAETSLTIEGIGVVIDCGYSRVPKFNPRTGLTTLETVRVSKASADQRAGRAGRLGPGTCYRLWSEGIHNTLQPSQAPEILEADLAPLLLELAEWGVSDFNELTWLDVPSAGAQSQAKDLLHQLGALQNDRITSRGKAMLRLPTHPRIAHMLLEASAMSETNALQIATDVAALLEEKDPLGKETGSDLSLRINLLREWRCGRRVNGDCNLLDRIERLAFNWRRIFKIQIDNTRADDHLVGKILRAAYPERVAKQLEKHSRRYKLLNGRVVSLPENDPLVREPWISVAHLDGGQSEGRVFIAAPLDEKELHSLAKEMQIVRWDSEREMLVGTTEQRIGSLMLSAKPIHKIPEEVAIVELLKVLREKGLQFIGWSENEIHWQARVLSLKVWRPEEAWPDVSEEKLISSAHEWLSPFLSGMLKAADFSKLNLKQIVATILPWELASKLDVLTPSKLEVPTGSMIKVQYFEDGRPPIMEVRLQELFGLTETPSVNAGRTKVILHLLSPGFKPVQVTQDLVSFWNNTYSEVRKELRARYPKHSWPEDPWTAEPIRGAKKRNHL